MHKLQHREKETTKDLKVKGKKRIRLKKINFVKTKATFTIKKQGYLA